MSSDRNILSDKAREQFDSYYKNLKLQNCPKCGENGSVIPAVCGKPTRDLMLYSLEGHVKLGNCCEMYNGWCNKCESYFNYEN